MTTYKIRPETEDDKPRIATLLARTYLGNGVKAIELVSEMRQQDNYTSDLSLVGITNGETVACAMFSPIALGKSKEKALVLASLGVDTRNPALDVAAFLTQAMDRAKRSGHRFVLMRGDLNEFQDSGFVKSRDLKLDFGKQETGDWLVKDLTPEEGEVSLACQVTLPSYLL